MSKIISQFVTFFSYLLTDALAYLCLIKRKVSEVFVAQNCLDRQEKKFSLRNNFFLQVTKSEIMFLFSSHPQNYIFNKLR